jgi:hypothetical protein
LQDHRASSGHEIRRFTGWRERKWNSYFLSAAIGSAKRLESQVLAVPNEWPRFLEGVEHLEIRTVPAVRGTDRQFDSMDYHRDPGASAPSSLDLLRNNLKLNGVSKGPLAANGLRRDLDKIDRTTPIQFSRQRREIGQTDPKLLNRSFRFHAAAGHV